MAKSGAPTLVSGLPRYIAVKSNQVDAYLTLEMRNAVPYLTFSEKKTTRLAAHEVVHNNNEKGVVMIRAPNGRFWQRNPSGYIVADRETVPNPSSSADRACYFRIFVNPNDKGSMVFQSIVDDVYLKRYTALVQSGFHASANNADDHYAKVNVIDATDFAVSLPRYIMLLGDNGKYVGDHFERDIDWLKFNKDTPRLAASHEVIRLLDGKVMMLNINLNKFWRRSPNWIWADVSSLYDATNNKDCQFDIIKLSNTLVAFKSVANERLLKRYSDYWEDMLCAIGTNTNDSTTRLKVSEALLSRKLFNIKYLLDLAEVSEITPVIVGSGSMRNDTSFTTTLEVHVNISRKVSNSQSWTNSSTFSTSLTVGFSVGVPEVASVNGSITVGTEQTFSTEIGKTIEKTVEFGTLYRVEGVPPGAEVKVTVQCTTAKCRIPFTYSSKDTRIDGVEFPQSEHIDGIFEGVNAFDIKGVASQEATSPITARFATRILPASIMCG